jgi:hypothetical protein
MPQKAVKEHDKLVKNGKLKSFAISTNPEKHLAAILKMQY